jgi:2-succinyl-6-hydroxy-2,4-cyclohexadiene-1-carboxylate synthase
MGPLAAASLGEGPLLVVLHGFTQAGSSWAPFLEHLAGPRRVLCVDLPGHGRSADVTCDLEGAARLVVELVDEEPFDLVGYSLGGRIALHVACQAPPSLRRAAAISAATGILDVSARAARLQRDVEMADDLEASGGVEAFVRRWLANPLFATLPPARADLDARTRNTASGLADSLRRCSLGTQRPLTEELRELDLPLLMVAGARDDPFAATACALAATRPGIAAALVPGSGHVCHLEQPAVTARLLESFLSSGS